MNLPEGDYETLGGLIMAHSENIPVQGEQLQINGFEIIITSSSSNRIHLVKLIKQAISS